VLAVYTLNNEQVIRLMPPLVITKEQLDEVLNRLDDALSEIYPDIEDLLE
jgi:putrescine aminotransferase